MVRIFAFEFFFVLASHGHQLTPITLVFENKKYSKIYSLKRVPPKNVIFRIFSHKKNILRLYVIWTTFHTYLLKINYFSCFWGHIIIYMRFFKLWKTSNIWKTKNKKNKKTINRYASYIFPNRVLRHYLKQIVAKNVAEWGYQAFNQKHTKNMISCCYNNSNKIVNIDENT